jgi:PBSX family phage terminase large subunit
MIAALCTRRAGKSYGAGICLTNAALQNPGVSCVYIALTKDSARKIMFKDIMRVIDRKFKLGFSFNEHLLKISAPNGSIIYFTGADATDEEMSKLLGQKLKLAVIDEAGSFRRDLRDIVFTILRPALADLDGQIRMISMPTNIHAGLFFDVVHNLSPGWSVHRWTAYDNPYMREAWDREIKDLIAANPRITETPTFKRAYLGEYAIDTSALVYKFSEQKNRTNELPPFADYTHVLGVDLGYHDPSAFVVCAYSSKSNKLFIIDEYKRSGMTISDVAEMIKVLRARYDISRIIVDNAAKQGVEEIKARYGIPLEAAEKQGKVEFIELMNSDFILGNILCLPKVKLLPEEWASLIWDDSERRREHPACENHLSDAALYAYRYCYQYLYRPTSKVIRTEAQKIDEWEEAEAERLKREEETPFWEAI